MTTLVCITGMHRSGTSMVARVLSEAGLSLGPPGRLMPAQPDNADGFFENLDLVRLGDALLDRLGGAWDRPPPHLGADDSSSALLAPLAERGAELLATLAAAPPAAVSGWKDPRAALVLPFWRMLCPDLRIVACLRHPLAVARSLRERNRVSLRYGVDLWQAYNTALLAEVQTGRAVVTHYDAWLAEPGAELQRVAEAIGLPVDAYAVASFVQSVRARGDLASEPTGNDALLALGGTAAVGLYDSLRAQAGPVYARTPEGQRRRAQAGTTPIVAAPSSRDEELLALRHRVGELDAQLARLTRGPAPYRVGTNIDARKGGNAPLYLGAGWAAPQDAGTWSLGERASVVVVLHALASGCGLELHARLRPMVGPGHESIGVTVLANGSAVANWTLNEPRMTSVSCALEADRLAKEQPLRLEFVIDRPCAPSALGLSGDTRPLGLLLVSLSLRAAAAR